ncbi:MAG: HNH endonuclease domain-containing protein [Candidatus Saelkia tenebricola]|nr:HNH endonuclease domain-containing protein [Candidatus Saelkia tenebricola]
MLYFKEKTPTIDSYWRSIVLFGRNVASYKFALAKTLIEIANEEKTFIKLEELAIPFAKHISSHIKKVGKQGTFGSSKFLDVCAKFSRNEISEDILVQTTIKLGFNDVIDCFHNVNCAKLPKKFYIDERKAKNGITITDNLFKLKNIFQYQNLPFEIEARWRLVETAWSLNISPTLLDIGYDNDLNVLFTDSNKSKRINITSCRDALNGYQKGKCFYCFSAITVEKKSEKLSDIDHFFPFILQPYLKKININGIWNLVLACKDCNRGISGKFACVPSLKYLERLHKRNSYLIASHHPLRETLIKQTGLTDNNRVNTLQKVYDEAKQHLVQNWKSEKEHGVTF